MMNGYGAAVVMERTHPRSTGLARYLASEYGPGTGPAYLEAVGRGVRRRAGRASRPHHALLPTILRVLGFSGTRPGRASSSDHAECSGECGGSASRTGG